MKRVIITGIDQIDRKLKTLEPRLQKKVFRQSMRHGMKIVQKEVVSQAPVESGLTKRNVKVRSSGKRKRGMIEIEVKISADPGLYKTVKSTGAKVFYPAIVEYKRDPFMRRAFAAKAEQARNVTIQSILDGIEKEASK